MQLDRNLVLARGLDRMFEMNFMPIDFVPDFVLQSRHDILRRDRAESFAGLAGFKLEGHAQFVDPPCQFFGFIQLARFAFGSFLFQILQLPQTCRRHFVRFAPRQQIISRVTATHFDDVRLGP